MKRILKIPWLCKVVKKMVEAAAMFSLEIIVLHYLLVEEYHLKVPNLRYVSINT